MTEQQPAPILGYDQHIDTPSGRLDVRQLDSTAEGVQIHIRAHLPADDDEPPEAS